MIIGIFGGSQTGKTTLAQALQRHLNVPLRSCGEVVKETAQDLGVSVDSLPDEEHRRIDADTVSWTASLRDCIVEGRFLDSVMPFGTHSLRLIQLIASDEIRCKRGSKDAGKPMNRADLRNIDEGDLRFSQRLYASTAPLGPNLTIDTSDMSIETSLRELQRFLETLPKQPA